MGIQLRGAAVNLQAARQDALGGNAIGHAFAHDIPHQIQVRIDFLKTAILAVKELFVGFDDFPDAQ